MATNEVSYIIKISTTGQASVEKATSAVGELNNKVGSSANLFKKLSKLAGGMFAMYKVVTYVQRATAAYMEESVAVTKLGKVMQNTMNATQAETQSILDLTAAQQKLGVIGDEVQLAGAQELATYLTKADSLKKLIPVMNDVVAQQYGLNATQEQSVQIATMMGKVMDGQTGALSRWGYNFNEAQEKILKFGTEEQRTATLADVVSASVGNVNAALANTPEGKLKQVADNMGDIQEKVGKAVISIKSAFAPAIEYIGSLLEQLTAWFERNQTQIISIVQTGAALFIRSFQITGKAIKGVADLFTWFTDGVKSANPVFLVAAGYIGTITVALLTYKTVMGIVTGVTKLWTMAQWALDAAMSANPIGAIIAAIVAYIALISYVIYKTDGWAKTWQNTVDFMGSCFEAFKTNFRIQWLYMEDMFMKGLENVQKGWYKVKGLWNKKESQEGLAELTRQRNERAAEIAAANGKLEGLQQKMSGTKVWEVTWNKDRKLSDLISGMKETLGITPPEIPGMTGTGTTSSVITGDIKNGTESIATGGTRSTNITIDIGKLLETVNIYAQEFSDGMNDLEDKVIEAVTRALVTAQSLAR